MSKFYFCYVNDADGYRLKDETTISEICLFSVLDFEKLLRYGYRIIVIETFYPCSSSQSASARRLSRRVSDYIIQRGHLPISKRIL